MPLSDFYVDGCVQSINSCGVAAPVDPCCYQYTNGTGCYQIDKIWTQCFYIPASTSVAIELNDLETDDCSIIIVTLKDIVLCNRTDTSRSGVIVNLDVPINVDIPPGMHFSYSSPCTGFAGIATLMLTNPDPDYQADMCVSLAGVSI